MRRVRLIARLGILALLAYAVGGGWLGRRLTYVPPRLPTPSPPPPPFAEIRLEGPAGPLVAWWRPPEGVAVGGGADAAAPALLFFYGNGGSLEACRRGGLWDDLARLGAAVLSVDYPGYGGSAGNPSEASLAAAADAALSWLRTAHPGRTRVAVGQSLGAAVAAGLAARRPGDVAGLALLSPFTSLADTARLHYPRWLVWMGLRERYDSRAAAARFDGPVLVLHGTDDALIPPAQGEALAAAFRRGRFVPVPGADHDTLTQAPAVWRALRAFLEEVAP